MSGLRDVDGGGDIRVREIQASIAEGKMMLHVLKSLPSSENNDAFIHRFEELVSRLEDYRTQLGDARASESVPTTITESVSRCSCLPSDPPQSTTSAASIPSAKMETSLNGAAPATSNSASADTSLPHLKKAAQFSIELDKLTAFIEDAERFEGMAGRLVDITKRAHLTEATGFLCEIRARFAELQRSFSSLHETYEAIESDSNVSKELHALQASSFSDFLFKLGESLESTKECFFTIYHLVKSNIEQGMADGSLFEVNDIKENGDTSEVDDQTAAITSPIPDNLPTSIPEDSTGKKKPPKALIRDSASSTLDAQKAYLATLQSQTRAEREEIDRLLKSRDELTGRLQTLQAAAVSAALNTQRYEKEDANRHAASQDVSSTSSDQSTVANSNASMLSALGLNQSVVDHLEAKRRELEQLKAQLALLKLAEEKMAIPDVSTPPDVLTVDPVQRVDDAAAPLDLQIHNGHEPWKSAPEREKQITTSLTCESNVTGPTHPVDFQTTAARPTAGDNLQSSIPEVGCLSSVAPAKPINPSPFGDVKPSGEGPLYFTSRASVATSHDRTTFATWGGSSAAPSSNNSISVVAMGEEDSTDAVLPLSREASVGALLNRSVSPVPDLANRTNYGIGSLIGPPTPRSTSNDPHSSNFVADKRTSFQHEHSMSMPQVGTSPSPLVNGSLECQSADSSYYAARCEASVTQNHQNGVDLAFTTGAAQGRPQSSDESVARLEDSVSQLYQICRYLVAEILQLNTTVTNLQLSFSRDAPRQHDASHPGHSHVPSCTGDYSSWLVQAPQPPAHQPQYRASYSQCSGPGTTLCDAAPMFQRLLPPDAIARPPYSQDPLLVLLSQLAQQQTQYYQLQTELQRLLLCRAQLTAGVSHYVSNQLTAPDSHVAAALLSSISYVPADAAHQRNNPSAELVIPQSHVSSSFRPFIASACPTSNISIPLPLGTRPLSAQSHTQSTSSTIHSAFDSHCHTLPCVMPANNAAASVQSSSTVGAALSAAVDLLNKVWIPPSSVSKPSQL